MTREEAILHYPGCPDAVLFHEHPMAELGWKLSRNSGRDPICIRDEMLLAAREAIFANTLSPMALIYGQMRHPDFLLYVTAKLGGM